MKPRLLDLFSGAGGAAKGYADAGFEVVGVDLHPQPEFPFEIHQADALTFLAEHVGEFDAYHASPPCHDHSALSSFTGKDGTGELLTQTHAIFSELSEPWVIENVGRAKMPGALVLCGSEFGLQHDGWWLSRHRQFLSNVPLWGAGGCRCSGKKIAGVYGHSDGPVYKPGRKGWSVPTPFAQQLLATPWINNRHQIAQAIPPAYTEFVGEQLLEFMARAVA